MKNANAIPGGAKMPLDRKKKATAIPGGGGGGAWLNGKQTESSKKYGAKAFGPEGNISEATGTSIFDPVLCEIAYRWFSPIGGVVIDPFAGGSVRGIVASRLGRKYFGVDLSERQIEANKSQSNIAGEIKPDWRCGDSRDIGNICKDVEADFIFSCPPYANLEVYSDHEKDLSTLEYSEFRNAYFEIIQKTAPLLKADRFACFVVGEVRDKKGFYYNFVGDTVEAFKAAGLSFYNEAIILTAIGSLPIRAGQAFSVSRKLGKTHQNVLIFVKGDSKKATEACGEIEIDCDWENLTPEADK